MGMAVYNNAIALICKENPITVHQFNPTTAITTQLGNLAARYDYSVLVSIPVEYFINEADFKVLHDSLWGLTI